MSNPLSANDSSKWISDGTDGATLSIEGSTITFGSAEQGTPYNIRLDDDNSSSISSTDSIYYEIEITSNPQGSIALGLVKPSEFKTGWKTRGMFYNGNPTNGSAGLLIGFGDHPKEGDTVGIYLQRNGDECKVVFYLNGRCLGPGFIFETMNTFYPCLHLDGMATVKYSTPLSFPSTIDRQSATFDDQYSGDWILKKAATGPELHDLPIPKGGKIVLNFTSVEPNTYRLSIKVANRINSTIKIIGKMENFDKIEVGPAMSTMMMPPPALQQLEQFMTMGLDTLFKMIVSSDHGDLVMTGSAAEMIFTRYERTFDPLTSYD